MDEETSLRPAIDSIRPLLIKWLIAYLALVLLITSMPVFAQTQSNNSEQPKKKTLQQRKRSSKTVKQYDKTLKKTVNKPLSVNGGVWDKVAKCESSGNWRINTGNGYYGGLQFKLSSWHLVGGSGYPHEASQAEQIARAKKLKVFQGWKAWPECSKKLGLR